MKPAMAVLALVATLASFYSLPANAATLITNVDGKLAGIRGIEYRGSRYDVEFLDGRCTDLFSGCDEISDFIFQSSNEAGGMANLLMNDIIRDSPAGMFDTNPALTVGCIQSIECQMRIPFGLQDGKVRYAAFLNGGVRNGLDRDFVIYEAMPRTEDLSIWGGFTFARFSIATPGAVPEPMTWAMMLLGIFSIGAGLRRSQSVRAIALRPS